MATVTITAAVNTSAGANFRKLAKVIERAVADMPDNPSSGASTVMTIDNGTGFATVQITAGPYQSALYKV